jgi:hypothetical protein
MLPLHKGQIRQTDENETLIFFAPSVIYIPAFPGQPAGLQNVDSQAAIGLAKCRSRYCNNQQTSEEDGSSHCSSQAT